jgi:acetyl esterase/lipase
MQNGNARSGAQSMTTSFEFDVADHEYLNRDGESLLARLYVPRGTGPFAAVVELHGGAWSQYDRTRGKGLHEALAKSGLVVAALDFGQGEAGAYPKGLADINLGIRWLKANAARFKTRADLIGISGNSSGGHLAMLTAMRPFDPRYTIHQLRAGAPEVDATVRCVVVFWPVINPIGRQRYGQRLMQSPNPPEWPPKVLAHSMSFWQSEANMIEGNPILALERGERVVTPPTIWIQSSQDPVHDYRDGDSDFPGTEPHRFVDRYRKAGGEIALKYFDAPALFTTIHPTMPQSVSAMNDVIEFIHRNIVVK